MCSWRLAPVTPPVSPEKIPPRGRGRRVSLSTACRMISASVTCRRAASAANLALSSSGKYTVVRLMSAIVPYVMPYVKRGGVYGVPMGSRGYDTWWGLTLRTTTGLHKVVDKLSGGRLWRRFPGGQQVIWISTLGRKSGRWRRTPLLAAPYEGAWVITGSNAGQTQLPGWVFNVRARPTGSVEIAGTKTDCTFIEVTGPQRDLLYRELVAMWSAYAMYERNAGREIPVFLVQPIIN